MKFNNGLELWNHHDKSWHYDPMFALCSSSIRDIKELVESKKLGTKEEHKSIIESSKWYLVSVIVHDSIISSVMEGFVYHDLHQNATDDVMNKWNGFTEEQIIEVCSKYVGLIDPLTMCYVDPLHELVTCEDGVYIYNCPEPVDEHDVTCFFQESKDRYEAFYDCEIYDMIRDDFVDMLPDNLRDVYYDN